MLANANMTKLAFGFISSFIDFPQKSLWNPHQNYDNEYDDEANATITDNSNTFVTNII